MKELVAKLGFSVEEGPFGKAIELIGSVRLGLVAAGAAAAGLAYAIGHSIEETAQHGLEVSKAAQRIGVTTDAFQELGFAAKASGLEAADMEQSLGFLARSAYAASQGGSDAYAAFARLGINVKDASGQVKPADELLMSVAERFKSMRDADKPALAMKLFGRAGRQMIPFLNRGAEGIAEMREEAHKFGQVLDKDTIGRSKEYIRVNREFHEALEGLQYAFAGPLIHANGFRQGLTKLIVAMIPIIRSSMEKVMWGIQKAMHAVKVVGTALLDVMKHMAHHWKLFATVLLVAATTALIWHWGTIATTVSWYAALGIASTVAGAKAAIAWLAATWPAIALGAIIVGLILLIDDFVTGVQGGRMALGRLMDLVTFPKVLDQIVKAVEYIRGDKMGHDFYDELVAKGAVTPMTPAQIADWSAGGPQVKLAPVFNADFTINAAPGMSAEDVANASRDAMDRWHANKIQEAWAPLVGPIQVP